MRLGYACFSGKPVRGTVHAAIGAAAPIGLVATAHIGLAQGAVMAAISGGFALLPDLDSSRSIVSQSLGIPLHRVVQKLCTAVLGRAGTGLDARDAAWQRSQGRDPAHRTLTHTMAAAGGVALLVYSLSILGVVTMGLMAAAGVLCGRKLPRMGTLRCIGVAAMAAVTAGTLLDPWLMMLAAGGGYVSHLLADACTMAGVPLLWPAKVRGRRWWKARFLGRLIRSGSKKEEGPALGVALAANVLLLLLMT